MDRFKQASTWAGLGVLFQVTKILLPSWAGVLDGLSAAAGSAAVAINERSAH